MTYSNSSHGYLTNFEINNIDNELLHQHQTIRKKIKEVGRSAFYGIKSLQIIESASVYSVDIQKISSLFR